MLVLSRKPGQELVIGGNIRIVVNRITGNRVSIGIEAPAEVSIVRGEIQEIRDEFQDLSLTPTESAAAEMTGTELSNPKLDVVSDFDSATM